LVARALHHYSMRTHQPWVDVSCGALPEHLVESELFGYEKGAFSGADCAKPGLFELAHRGTLFLDEIGELDPKMQVKLLRVLDGVPYYRLGGVRRISGDVRITAATNQHLEEAVEQGRFRKDLYYRLSQFTIKVPPLRDRVEDIVPIAKFFLKQQNEKLSFTPEAMRGLERHNWSGNIRELRNTVIKSAIMARQDGIELEDLPPEFRSRAVPDSGTGALLNLDGAVSSLDQMERRMIHEVLAKTRGHQQKAAELLGISRRTLSRKLNLYNMEASQLAMKSS
jgi:two-component system, NtrC family, response regulator AtoC